MKYAITYGADAVYFGGAVFGLRANAINFSMDDIKESVAFAHNLGKKVYVTVNITLHNKEIETLVSYLKDLNQLGVDAIIVSDPAVIELASKNTSLEIHLSTQQSTLNYEAIKFWKKQGVTRIVMGRETSQNEIKEIMENVDLEIETFIHGAMCAGYSGRCVLSNFLTARDANRGGCSQICRWDFNLLSEDLIPLKGDQDFTFCAKDLSQLKHIPEMIKMGIISFKIEGRMRSVYYIATVVHMYRQVIDEYFNNPETYQYNLEYEKVLSNCANRDSISQFFAGPEGKDYQYYSGRIETSNQDFLALVLSYDQVTKMATIEQRNYFKTGDQVCLFGPHTKDFYFTVGEIYDDKNQVLEIVNHPQQVVKIMIDQVVYPNDMIRINK